MLTDWKFWVLTIVSALALTVSVSNFVMRQDIVERQQQVLQRQQFINEAQSLSQFNSQFIRALASLAAQTNDANITQLLADNGITYQVNEPAQPETVEPEGEQP